MVSVNEKVETGAKMKVALCLHGLVGNTKSGPSYEHGTSRDESDLDDKKLCAELAF